MIRGPTPAKVDRTGASVEPPPETSAQRKAHAQNEKKHVEVPPTRKCISIPYLSPWMGGGESGPRTIVKVKRAHSFLGTVTLDFFLP